MERAKIEIKVGGEWKVWAIYEESMMGLSPLELAEMGLKIARNEYYEIRLTVENLDHGEEI